MQINAIIKSLKERRVAQRNYKRKKETLLQNFHILFPFPLQSQAESQKNSQQRAHKATQHQCNHSTSQYLSVQLYSKAFLLLLSSNSSSISTPKITGWLYRRYLIYAAPKSYQPSKALSSSRCYCYSSSSLCSANRSLIKARQVCLTTIVIITWFQVLPE